MLPNHSLTIFAVTLKDHVIAEPRWEVNSRFTTAYQPEQHQSTSFHLDSMNCYVGLDSIPTRTLRTSIADCPLIGACSLSRPPHPPFPSTPHAAASVLLGTVCRFLRLNEPYDNPSSQHFTTANVHTGGRSASATIDADRKVHAT
jgi:hypothetical protein